MEEYFKQMAELLEVDSVNTNDELNSFEAWDSLTILSIIAFVNDSYAVTLNANEIKEARTIGGLKKVIDSKKK